MEMAARKRDIFFPFLSLSSLKTKKIKSSGFFYHLNLPSFEAPKIFFFSLTSLPLHSLTSGWNECSPYFFIGRKDPTLNYRA
jgi:hypothetical protein